MNYDLALISAILDNRDFATVAQSGLRPTFLGGEAQAYWDVIVEHYDQFHEVPTLEFFQGTCPGYAHMPTKDSIESIIHEIKTRYLFGKIETVVERVANVNSADPWEARRELSQLADSITVEVQRTTTDLVAGSDKSEVLKRIEFLRSNKGLLGYPWPWPYVNENSPGICPGNLIYFYGREGVRKTFLLCYLANFFERQGLRVLLCTREMTLEEIAWRIYPMRLGMPYQEMTSGQISSDGMLRLEDALDELHRSKNIIVTEVDGGISGLRGKIEEVKPQVVIHDFMFALAEDMMEGSRMREHDAIGGTVNGLKRLAMKLKIPIIACGHANRDGVKLKGRNSTEVAGSDKIARRCDYGVRVITNDAEDHMALIFMKARQARKNLSFTMDCTLCEGFGSFVSTDTSWVDALDDVKEAENGAKGSRPPAPSGKPRISTDSFRKKRGGVFKL